MLSSLDLLDQLDHVVTKKVTAEIIDWIYNLQVRPYSLNSGNFFPPVLNFFIFLYKNLTAAFVVH
jgi:hypothetical protein